MAGLEVDSIEHLGASLDNVVVGKIISIEKHPDADKLNVCQVDVGNKELQIVCGAPNARAGIKIPCALIGAKFGQFEIKKAKLRGVESFGMLCSSKEIGLSDSADGLLELSQDLNLGDRISDALDLNDSVLDISLTPNRADCLSVQGIAREIKSLTGNPFHLPKIQKIESNFKSDQKVNVIDSNNCPLYCGVEIAGLNNTINLPKELISYLSRSDISSINPVVDLVNYVMLETGQPMHAFAKDKLTGSIDVRPSKTGEKIVLLNDQEVTLKENDLVIADEKNVLAIAGVMGGKNSSVDYDTKNIFIESAFFTPLSMAGKARNYGLNTDSSHRFERGVDFANSQNALMRLINLIQQYCGGDVSDIQEHKATLPQRSLIKVRPSRVERILGTKVSIEQMESIFINLGFEFKNSGSEFEVYPPSYRFDLTIEEDLIEEVIRIIGYDNVEAKDPITSLSPLSTNFATYSLDEVRNKISHLGFNELVSYSFIDAEKERDIHFNIDEQIILENPIAENMNAMRSHLWSSHLDALKFNINRGQDRIKFFEIAKSFTKNDESFN
jgi:phenylalanyl-tRNA synthetase beta chain